MNNSILDTDHIGKLLFKLSVPAFFGMVVMALYNIVDTIFIGRYIGSLGIAGLSIVFPFQMLAQGFGQMAGIGGASLISRMLGSKNTGKAERTLGNAVLIGAGLGLAMSLLIVTNMDFWLPLAGASETILPYAKEYMSVIISFAIFMTLVMTLHSVVVSEGNTTVPMMAMISGAIINIILDAIFIIVFGWGIKGAAAATIISNVFSLSCFLWHYFSGRSTVKLHWKNLIPDFKIVGQICIIGISGLAMTLTNSLSAIIINNLLVTHGGDIAVSTFGLINRAMVFVFMPCMVVAQGVQPIVGFNYGAQKYDRIFKILRIALTWSSGVAFLGFSILYLFPSQIMGIFTTEPELIASAADALRKMFLAIYLFGFITVSSITFQALGKAVQSFIASIARPALILIPTLFIMSNIWGLDGVWYSYPVTDVLTALVITGLFIPQLRELRKKRDMQKVKSDSRIEPVIVT